MALKYEDARSWERILPILEEHTEWFHRVLKLFFYSGEIEEYHLDKKPTSFAEWMVESNRENVVQPEIIEKLASLHSDLFKASDILVHNVRETGQKPALKNFQKFMTIYEEFLFNMRRLEKDALIEGAGYDSFTGLRSPKLLVADIEREIDRLDRQGKSFSIALARIDNFSKIHDSVSHDELSGCVKLISDLIKLSVRSFDDAYYLGNGEYILSLKQADVTGGISALERLRKELEHKKIVVGGSGSLLSMSCCIVEPLVGYNINEMIKNLRDDLNNKNHLSKADTVLEYRELSPLQRYLQEHERV